MASEFLKGLTVRMLPKIILETLMENKIHGYALIVLVRRKYGVYSGPSTVYPMLNNMEDLGLIKSMWDLSGDRPKKVYDITLKGKNLLAQMNLDVKMVFEVLTCER